MIWVGFEVLFTLDLSTSIHHLDSSNPTPDSFTTTTPHPEPGIGTSHGELKQCGTVGIMETCTVYRKVTVPGLSP